MAEAPSPSQGRVASDMSEHSQAERSVPVDDRNDMPDFLKEHIGKIVECPRDRKKLSKVLEEQSIHSHQTLMNWLKFQDSNGYIAMQQVGFGIFDKLRRAFVNKDEKSVDKGEPQKKKAS